MSSIFFSYLVRLCVDCFIIEDLVLDKDLKKKKQNKEIIFDKF